MNHPIQSVFVQIATSHWLRLECATRSRIPIGLRSAIDAEQVVNDSIDEWMTRVSETMRDEAMEPMDLDALVGLLMFILKCHTTDAIRKEIAWKRGGRTINSGEKPLQYELTKNRDYYGRVRIVAESDVSFPDELELRLVNPKYSSFMKLEVKR